MINIHPCFLIVKVWTNMFKKIFERTPILIFYSFDSRLSAITGVPKNLSKKN